MDMVLRAYMQHKIFRTNAILAKRRTELFRDLRRAFLGAPSDRRDPLTSHRSQGHFHTF